MARGVALRPGRSGPPTRRALLVALLMVSMALAGCHGGVPEPAAEPVAEPAPRDVVAAPLTRVPPLPRLDAEAQTEGGLATLHIHVDGDPAEIVSHEIDWGDGTRMRPRDGAPPLRYTHEYRQPPDWRFDPITFTATIGIYGEHGNTRKTQVPVVIEPPTNRPPVPDLRPVEATVEVPARITFRLGATDEDGKIASWHFTPGDGTPPSQDSGAPVATYSHAYGRIGTYTATLTVTDDAGATVRGTSTVRVLPPQDRTVWSLSSHNGTAYQSDAMGRLLASHTLLGPCAFEGRCPRVVDGAASDDAFAVLIDDTNTSRLVVLDGAAGHIRHQQTLPASPVGLAVDPDGRYWITHRDGTITWTYGDSGPRSVQVPAHGADIRMAFSGTTTWALVSDVTARLYQIDPVAGRASVLALPHAAPAQHLAVNLKHDVAVVVDQGARAYIAAATLYGPRLVRVAALEGGVPTGLACPDGHDRCWTALDGTIGTLVAIDVAALPTSVTAAASTLFGEGLRPTGVFAADRHLVVPTAGPTNATHLLDPVNGQLLGTVTPPSGTTPHHIETHPRHRRIVYAGEGTGWNIIDLDDQRIVHLATEPGGDLGPWFVALPRR